MNVLIEFGSGAEDFDDDVYTEVLDHLNIENCVLIHNNEKILKNRKIYKYVTQALFAPSIIEGDYQSINDIIEKSEPLDDELLNKMAPYENEVMYMMLRWSKGEYTDLWHDYCNHIRFWNYILESNKIDVFFTTEVVHDGFNYVLFLLCKIKGISYFSTERIGFPDRLYMVSGVHDQLPFFKQEYADLCVKYLKSNIDEITLRDDMQEMYTFYTGGRDRTPAYMKNRFMPKRRKWAIWLYVNVPMVKWIFDFYVDNNFSGRRFREIKDRIKFLLRLSLSVFSFSMKTNELFSEYSTFSSVFRESSTFLSYYKSRTSDVEYGKKYIYVPLQYQPERTSSPLGGKFVDHLLMIKMLSYYLPEGWLLYVKEHPTFINAKYALSRATWRTKKFYDELASLKNIVLVNMQEDTYKLIDNSQAVAVITGTAGLEAVTQGKKCLMFGFNYLQYAPNVIHIRDNKDCSNAMEELQQNTYDDDLKKKIKIYFKTLENYCFVGRIVWWDVAHTPDYLEKRMVSWKNIVSSYLREIKRTFGSEVFK